MNTYKLGFDPLANRVTTALSSSGWAIPFDTENTDYQQFKKDLMDGTFLKDAEGNDMTAEQITTFLGTLE
jgi:hypothetical protein